MVPEHIKKTLGRVQCEVAGEYKLPCHRPLYATKDDDLEVRIRENKLEAQLEDGEYLEIACGNCEGCRLVRAREWAIRATHESQMHTRKVDGVEIPANCFITLTYDDEHLPEDGSLKVEDWQNFAKKLRRDVGPFRFLQCGEYGPKTGRPHFHACLFGIDFAQDREVLTRNGGKVTWSSQQLSETWSKGFTMLAPMNYATASYTAGYVMKKAKAEQWKTSNAVWKSDATGRVRLESLRKQEFNTMSRRPGLGSRWLTRYWMDVYPSDQVTIDGNTYRPPKYYDTLLKKINPPLWEEVMEKRTEFLSLKGPTEVAELRGRMSAHKARMEMYKRRDKV